MDLDVEQLMGSTEFETTRFGRYLRQPQTHFAGPIGADIFCLFRLELEISVQAKALLLAREARLAVTA